MYSCVFELHNTRYQHAGPVGNLEHTEIREVFRSFSLDYGLRSKASHLVVVVSPRLLTSHCPVNLDRWGIDFKSIRIVRKVMELMQLPGGSNAFGRRTSSSTESQRALLWRDGSSRRSSIACSLAACSRDPRRNRSARTARVLLTIPSSPLILFLYPLHPAVAITRPHQGCHMGRLRPPPAL